MKKKFLLLFLGITCFTAYAIPHSMRTDDESTQNVPAAIPVFSSEYAAVANEEAIAKLETKRERERLYEEKQQTEKKWNDEDWEKLDFSRTILPFLFAAIPVLLILSCTLYSRKRIKKERMKQDITGIKSTFSPLLLLIPVVFFQWFCANSKEEYSALLYDRVTVFGNDSWSFPYSEPVCAAKIKWGAIKNPIVYADSQRLQETSIVELRKEAQDNYGEPLFAEESGSIFVHSNFVGSEVHVYSEKHISIFIKELFSIKGCLIAWLVVFCFWLFVQIRLNGGIYIFSRKAFREKCMIVCMFSFSLILAGAFWSSNIPLDNSGDGHTYSLLACSPNIILECLYHIRTPGYPLLIYFVNLFSPISLHSIVFFQTLLYLLSLSWLLYELYKKQVPAIPLMMVYVLFYNFMAYMFFKVMCETMELACIAAMTAMGIRLSDIVLKKKRFFFFAYLFLTALLVFFATMIKPFPGLIMLPSGVMFFCLLGSIRIRKLFLLTLLVGVVSLSLPFLYCTIRWKMCGDFNFASLIYSTAAGSELASSTPQSLNAPHVREDQKDLALAILHYYEQNNPTIKNKWPAINENSSYIEYISYRQQLLYQKGIDSFFSHEYHALGNDIQNKYHSSMVYTNDRCKQLKKIGDPRIKARMSGFYWDSYKRLITDPTLSRISQALRKYNPYQSSWYFHLTVSLPLVLFILIAFVPACKNVRFGSWKTTVIIIGSSIIPLFTFCGQALFLGALIFESRSEMVMFFNALLGTLLLSMYCIYSLIISLILALRLLYLKCMPEKLKRFISDAINTAFSYFKCVTGALIQLIHFIPPRV